MPEAKSITESRCKNIFDSARRSHVLEKNINRDIENLLDKSIREHRTEYQCFCYGAYRLQPIKDAQGRFSGWAARRPAKGRTHTTDFVLNLTKSGYFSGFRALGTDFVLNLAKSCYFWCFKNRPGRAHRSIFGWIGAFWGLPGCARSIVDYRRGLIGGSSEAHRRLIARRLIARSSVHFRLVCSFFLPTWLSKICRRLQKGGSSGAHRRLIAGSSLGGSSVPHRSCGLAF